MAQNTMININNVWKSSVVWLNVGGVWKKSVAWVNNGGIWKQCGIISNLIIIYIPSSGDATSQTQSKIVSIPFLQSVISCTVNTGSVSYTTSGTDVTINASGGNYVRLGTPTTTENDIRQTVIGGNPTTLPITLPYNSGGYIGTLIGGVAFVVSGTPADSKIGNATLGTTYAGAPVSDLPALYNYNLNGYVGSISGGTPYIHSGTYTAEDTIFVTAQLTADYNSGGYVGTLTIYVYSGSAPVSKVGNATLGTNYPGAPSSDLPSSYSYSLDGYTGIIPAVAPAYVYSGSSAGSKTCTGTWGSTYHVINGVISGTDVTSPSTILYNDGEYSGTLNQVGVSSLYQSNYNAYVYAATHGTSWTGYIGFDYSAILSKLDTRIWRRDYSGTVWTADTRVYRYQGNVTKPASDTRIWYKDYSGTVYRPDTQIWQVNYSGTVYTPYYSYVVSLNYL